MIGHFTKAGPVIDGALYRDRPDRWREASVVYMVGPGGVAGLKSWLQGRDTAWAPVPRMAEARSITLRYRRCNLTICGGDAWGLPADPTEARRALVELQCAVESEGWRWSRTAGGVARQLWGEVVPADQRGQLPERWRPFAHAALWQGPTVAPARGVVGEAVQIDRRKAYLRALDVAPLAERVSTGKRSGSGWVLLSHPTIAKIARLHRKGRALLVRARVEISPAFAGVPPLPIRGRVEVGPGGRPDPRRDRRRLSWTAPATIYPVGSIVGAWSGAHFLAAVESGLITDCSLIEVACSPAGRIGADYAARVLKVESPSLRRLLYTRGWGLLGSRGGFIGQRIGAIPGAAGKARIGWEPARPDTYRQGALYRPDWAAAIAGENAGQMARALAVAGADTHLVHVDAIWTSPQRAADVQRLVDVDGWKVKGAGRLEVLGVGSRIHAGEIAVSGLSRRGGKITEDRARRWLSGWQPIVRRWVGSRSLPLERQRTDYNPGPWADPGAWTQQGWTRPPEHR